MEIQYQAAEDKNGNLVFIENVTETERNNGYFCASCHKEVIPVLGNYRVHHFRHKVDHECNGETYLHRLAKEVLKKRFDSSSEFKITFEQAHYCDLYNTCCHEGKTSSCKEIELVTIDLKDYYDECRLELYDPSANKTPDLVLLDSKERFPHIWLEIFVSHHCTEEKLATEGVKIIEFEIKTEEDALSLAQIEIKQNAGPGTNKKTSDKQGFAIRFYKFKDKGDTHPLTMQKETDITRVALLRTGDISNKRLSCREVNYVKEPQGNEIVAIRFIDHGVTNFCQAMKQLAHKEIGNFRSCYWCRNSYSPQSGCTFCSCFDKLEIDRVNQTYLPYHCGEYKFLAYGNSIEVYLREGTTLEQVRQESQQFPAVPALPATFNKSLLMPRVSRIWNK